ncbi:MAG: methanogenesis marker 3 protein [Methanomassiliicoccales archaeon]|nr:methanogenesis marker 3 protein [Methanomassiliicoccales archaeon]
MNSEPVEIAAASSLSEAIKGQPYQPGSLIALIRSSESMKRETDEFDLSTPYGPMRLKLNDSKYAALFREMAREIVAKKVRWQTSKVLAIGSFSTQIEMSHDIAKYERFDCFFALGGFDSKSTYLMVAKSDHEGQYGSPGGVLGRITRGRHILAMMKEGESLLDISPVVEEFQERNVISTDDLKHELTGFDSIETYVKVRLDKDSPVACEHFLVNTEKGVLPITDRTETYCACSTGLDVSLIKEKSAIREPGVVTVRNEGSGAGRIYFYLTRRQVSKSHSVVGNVVQGLELLRSAPANAKLTLLTDPARIMVIGMSQAEGQRSLEGRGLKQRRAGNTADDAIIVEQEPELTMEALHESEIETHGVPLEQINDISLMPDVAPHTYRYFRRMTGLDHKPIGTMKVYFTFPDMPLVSFEGNAREAASLIPENTFTERSPQGELGVTNMSRPNRGLIGIRLEESNEFGPTGEERYGTNVVGKIVSSLDLLKKDLTEESIIYVRETLPAPKKAAKRTRDSGRGKKNAKRE